MSVKDVLQGLTPHKQMQFSPVDDDDDELSEFIKSDPLNHDDNWDLSDAKQIDGAKLDAFWTDALKELGPLEAEQDDQL